MNHDAGFKKWSIPGVIETSICPRHLITARSDALLRMYGHYKNGHLLLAGGIAEQPYVFLEAMQVIEAHLGSRDGD